MKPKKVRRKAVLPGNKKGWSDDGLHFEGTNHALACADRIFLEMLPFWWPKG